MPRFIVTGSYTSAAMKGMIESPSDRAASVKALVEAAGGTMEAYYATTGPSDFLVISTIDDVTDLMAVLMAAGASGSVSNLQTQRAFTSEELLAMQKRAGELVPTYVAPN